MGPCAREAEAGGGELSSACGGRFRSSKSGKLLYNPRALPIRFAWHPSVGLLSRRLQVRFLPGAPSQVGSRTMVDVAQLVEPRIVIPAVAGSSPVVHPTLEWLGASRFCWLQGLWAVSSAGRAVDS